MTFSWGPQATSVRPLFFHFTQRVMIVVEDIGDEKFYEIILDKLLGDLVDIRKVVGMGGKSKVVTRHKARSANKRYKSEYYIVDGDFDRANANGMIAHPAFHTLHYYDIESTIVDQEAVVSVLDEELPRSSTKMVRSKIDYKNWNNRICRQARDWVKYRAVATKNGCPVNQIGNNLEPHLTNSGANVKASLSTLIDNHVKANGNISAHRFYLEMQKVGGRIGRGGPNTEHHIPGKDGLLRAVRKRIEHISGHRIPTESLRFRLAKHSKLGKLSDLRSDFELWLKTLP